MEPRRNEWSLVALWVCVLYFSLLAAFFFGNYVVAPIALVSDYDPNKMTRDDLMAIAGAIGRAIWIQFMLTAVGAIALFVIAAWLQKQSNSRVS